MAHAQLSKLPVLKRLSLPSRRCPLLLDAKPPADHQTAPVSLVVFCLVPTQPDAMPGVHVRKSPSSVAHQAMNEACSTLPATFTAEPLTCSCAGCPASRSAPSSRAQTGSVRLRRAFTHPARSRSPHGTCVLITKDHGTSTWDPIESLLMSHTLGKLLLQSCLSKPHLLLMIVSIVGVVHAKG